MATVEIRTSAPMTMTPDCSSMMTFAGRSGSTLSCSMLGQKGYDIAFIIFRALDFDGGGVRWPPQQAPPR